MSSIRRTFKILYGLFLMASAILLLTMPEDGAEIVILILDIALLIYGFRRLFYYFTMARHMVGGIMTLYKSIILIDFGLFVFFLYKMPYRLMMIYLISVMGFHSVTSILSAFEMKRLHNHSWKKKAAYSLINLMLAISSLLLIGSLKMVTVVFCIGLVNSAIYNIESALKKSAIIYIG